MIGRRFMGRINSRLTQAKAGMNPGDHTLGGVSCVCSGDPAQCDAISDQQLYDTNAHKDTVKESDAQKVQLSNTGMAVYEEFDDVVVLSKIHRLTQLSEATTDEQRAYNERCIRFAGIQLRMRDMTLTSDDYFWLCMLMRSKRSAKDRLFFKDAPVLMEFWRTTELNNEESCEHYSRRRLRALAKETKVPVIAFDAIHEGTPQDIGMSMSKKLFNALPPRLELAVGALVILLHNLAVELGLMNGSQGIVVDIVYAQGDHPNHDCVANRMPCAVVVDFPGYSGPAFFSDPSRRTWVVLEPKTQESGERSEITRKQFPLVLAWAITPWKAQGMTLEKVIVSLSHACSKPGVLFVALTRVRHPDNLLLKDDFPAFSMIRRQLLHPNFIARQKWERRMLVLFSLTVRRRMRSE